MKRLFASILLLTGLAQAAHAETFTIDPNHTSLVFHIRHLVSEVEGRFNTVSGTINYDAANPAASSVNLSIDTKSVDTGNQKRDDHLRSKDFFDVATYPTATYVSKSVKKIDDKTIEVTGDFTLHGVTKSLVTKVEIHGPATTPMGKRLGAISDFQIDRRVYKVNSWNDPNAVVGDDVTLRLSVEAVAK